MQFDLLVTSSLDTGESLALRSGRLTPAEKKFPVTYIGEWVSFREGLDVSETLKTCVCEGRKTTFPS